MFDSQLLFQGPGCDVNFDDPTLTLRMCCSPLKTRSRNQNTHSKSLSQLFKA